MRWGLGFWLGCIGCVKSPPASLDAPFVWEAQIPAGEVRVVPGLAVLAPLEVELGDFLGDGLSETRLAVRTQRAAELNTLSTTVGLSMPGALHKELGGKWEGDFREAVWPERSRMRLERAVERGTGVDLALGAAAKAIGGEASLITWVDRMTASPLSLRAFPGDLIPTSQGMVLVDHVDEPYVVDLRVGVALVSADGQVLIRYRDEVQSLLSGGRSADVVGRDAAQQLAQEIAKIWAVGDL